MTCTDTTTFTSSITVDGEHYPATPRTTFDSTQGDVNSGIGVAATIDPEHGLTIAFDTYGMDAVLDVDRTRALINHLETILETADDSPAVETATPDLSSYLFSSTRTWRGEQVPASIPYSYPTVDQHNAVTLEYVTTPEGPVVLVDGSRPISLDATHTLMQDMALYRTATDSVGAFQRRRAAGQEQQR